MLYLPFHNCAEKDNGIRNPDNGDQILVGLGAGADNLTVDFSDSNLTKSITYDGGDPAVGQGDAVLELVVTDRVRAEGSIDARDRWKVRVGVTLP